MGSSEKIMLATLLIPVALVLAWAFWKLLALQRSARRGGYPSTMAYLRAAPRTDWEKREAVEMALQGLLLCFLAVLVKPFVFLGLVPLYFGVRKVALAWLGLDLLESGPAGPSKTPT